jgi:putative flippase GtrA
MSENVKKLEVIGTIKEGVGIGVKNIGPILVNLLLYVLTVWIPYLNVGTTIGLSVGIVSKASKGESIPFTEIFNPKYRKYMGEFFLTCGLVGVGVAIGFVFLIIPGYVIALAWGFAPMLAIDKGKNPAEAITVSNNITYGNKWRIFGISFLVCLALSIVVSILSLIPGLGVLLAFIVILFAIFVFIGIQASMYKQLAANV